MEGCTRCDRQGVLWQGIRKPTVIVDEAGGRDEKVGGWVR